MTPTGRKIIGVHVPKCAGESLRAAVEKNFTREEIYWDYGDSPLHPGSRFNTLPNYLQRYQKPGAFHYLAAKKIVYGHFHPNKYRMMPDALRVTILRNPVERMVSHYYYWKVYKRHNHPLHDYFRDNDLSIEQFAELEPIQRFYSGVFFKDVDMQTFDAIGAVEHIDPFMATLNHLTGIDFNIPVVNTNLHKDYNALKHEFLADRARVRHLEGLLSEDTAFYQRWAGHGCD